MNPISGFILISLIVTLGYFVGVLNYLSAHEEDNCEITYMFEYPQFVRISHKLDKTYPKYELYAYSEGRHTEKARSMYFDGIPVLFVPGNAGSYKQVRSLSSVALRKALNSRLSYHLDYFTVNLNAEYSALNGALLYDQLEYVNSSVYRVLELYKSWKNPPKSIVLIGHSMGGVLIRKLLSLQDPNSDLFSIVLTMAAPLKRPAILLDQYMHHFYSSIKTNTTSHPKTTVISISGGFSDLLISPTITNVKDVSLNVATNNIPLSWTQAHHVQILWCKQTILVINRALFDCVDKKTLRISNDSNYREAVFRHHLVHHSGIKIQQIKRYNDVTKFDSNRADWIENLALRYSVNLKQGIRKPHWYMFRLTNDPSEEALIVLALNLEVVNWAFVCGAHFTSGPQRVCDEGYHLTQFSEIAPSVEYKRRILRVNLRELKENFTSLTHVVVKALPTSEPLTFHFDKYATSDRQLTINLPKWYSFRREVVLPDTTVNAVHYDLMLPQFQHILQSYRLFLEPFDCSTKSHHATATLSAPWSHQDQHAFITEETPDSVLDVRLYYGKPVNYEGGDAYVRLTLEPTCRYRVSMQTSLLGFLGQLARNYSTLLFVNIAVVVLMALRTQLQSIDQTGQCSLFFSAMKAGVKPYYVLTSVKLLTRFLSMPGFLKVLPMPDSQILVDDGMDFVMLPLILYLCSVGIVWILAIIFSISLVTLEGSINKFALKFLAKTVKFPLAWSDYILSAFHRLPMLVAGLLVSLSLSTCGGLALALGMIFYFLKLTQMSQDLIEEVVWYAVKNFARNFRNRFRRRRVEAETTVSTSEAVTAVNNEAERKEDGNENVPDSVIDDEIATTVQDERVTSATEATPTINGDATSSNLEIKGHSAIFFHSSIFFLWFLIALLNVPTVLTWAHNFNFSKTLKSDPSFWPGFILSVCSIPLWQLDLPKANRQFYNVLEKCLLVVSVVSLIYAPISLYRLNYLLCSVIVLITLHQMFAPDKVASEEGDGDDDSKDKTDFEGREKYDDVKAKME